MSSINPWCACTAKVMVLGLCLCVSVSLCVHSILVRISWNYTSNKKYKQLQCDMGSKNKKALCFVRIFICSPRIGRSFLLHVHSPLTFLLYVHIIVHTTYNTFINKYAHLFSCVVNNCTKDLHFSAFITCVFSAVVKSLLQNYICFTFFLQVYSGSMLY